MLERQGMRKGYIGVIQIENDLQGGSGLDSSDPF